MKLMVIIERMMKTMLSKYEIMRANMDEALRRGDKLRRETLGDMVAAIGKAAVAGKTKVEITDDLVDDTMLKYKKALQESIDTCPDNEKYSDLRDKYCQQMEIVKEYAPKIMDNPIEIKNTILYWMNEMGVTKFDKKIFMPMCKQAKMDMKIVNQVIKEFG